MGVEVNADTFEKEVIRSEIPVLVDFWGPQCGPCLSLMPHVKQLAEKYSGKAKLVTIDATKNKRFCISLKVVGLPTYLFYKNGKEIERFVGGNVKIGEIEASIKKMIE